jgi:hypothetical protein
MTINDTYAVPAYGRIRSAHGAARAETQPTAPVVTLTEHAHPAITDDALWALVAPDAAVLQRTRGERHLRPKSVQTRFS